MKRLALTLALLVGATLPMQGRDEKKPSLPDDLALVPASARAFGTIRVADLWASSLGKEIRKAMAPEAEALAKQVERMVGVGPAGIERVTAGMINPREPAFLIFKLKAKADARVVERLMPRGKEETVGKQVVRVAGGQAAFLKEGKILVLGQTSVLRAMLGENAPGEAMAQALARAAGTHALVAYADPAMFRAPAPLPLEMSFVKPFLAAKSGVAWADVGGGLKLGFAMAFTSDKDAARGEKVLEAARAVAIAGLASYGDELGKWSKPLAELVAEVEKSLAKSAVKRNGATVSTLVNVKVEEAAAVGLLVEAAKKVRAAASRTRSQNNLKQIGLALHNYHDTHGVFPPQAICDKAGKPLLSWRVAILPFIEQNALYKQFKLDEPWDSAHNKKLLARMPRIYASVQGKATQPSGTFYQGFFGKGAGFEGPKGLRITSITDGTSNTLLAVEAGKDVPWSKPEDIPFDVARAVPQLGGEYADGFNALFFDGSVRFIRKTINQATLKLLIQRADGTPVPNNF